LSELKVRFGLSLSLNQQSMSLINVWLIESCFSLSLFVCVFTNQTKVILSRMSKSINDLIIEDQEAQEQEDQSQDELQVRL